MYESLKFCLSIHHLICFHLLLIMNKAAINIHIQIFLGTYFSFLLGPYLEMELLDHVVTECFNCLKNYQVAFQSDCTILYPLQQYMRVLIPVQPHSDFSDFFFGYSHPGGVKWYLAVFWICISLMTNDVDRLFMCFLPFVYLLRNVISDSLPILRLGYLSFYC